MTGFRPTQRQAEMFVVRRLKIEQDLRARSITDEQRICDAPRQPDRSFVLQLRPAWSLIHTLSSRSARAYPWLPACRAHAGHRRPCPRLLFAVRTLVRASTIPWTKATATRAGRSPGSRVVASSAPSQVHNPVVSGFITSAQRPCSPPTVAGTAWIWGTPPYHVPILIPSRGTSTVFLPGKAERLVLSIS